ncbi:hypothetical protein FB451DRAFT_1396680 [Mycena latifolia]|nr:hypothetical protein FB451DRAFT_1396680 [Mycena latifolia]
MSLSPSDSSAKRGSDSRDSSEFPLHSGIVKKAEHEGLLPFPLAQDRSFPPFPQGAYFLFSYAIRRSISLYLYRLMTLATLGASVSISTRSLVFSRHTLKWPLLSTFFLILTGIQTWTTLLTPVPIVISTPLHLCALLLGLVYWMNTWLGSEAAIAPVGSMDVGHAAAKMAFGFNTSVTFLGETFSASTAGIWPATLEEINMVTWVPATGAVPPTIANKAPLPQGIMSNYSVIQQGLMADVSCHSQKLTTRTTPSLHMRNGTVQTSDHQDADDLVPVTWVQMTSNCPVVHYGTQDAVTYYGYAVVFAGYQNYDFLQTTVCTVASKASVGLGWVPDAGPALVRTGEYGPLLSGSLSRSP